MRLKFLPCSAVALSFPLLTSHQVQTAQSESLCVSDTEQTPLLGKHWLWAPASAASATGEGVDVCVLIITVITPDHRYVGGVYTNWACCPVTPPSLPTTTSTTLPARHQLSPLSDPSPAPNAVS